MQAATMNASAVEAFSLRRIRAEEVGQILHLRDAIDMTTGAASPEDFAALEKKEMNAASCSRSNIRVI